MPLRDQQVLVPEEPRPPWHRPLRPAGITHSDKGSQRQGDGALSPDFLVTEKLSQVPPGSCRIRCETLLILKEISPHKSRLLHSQAPQDAECMASHLRTLGVSAAWLPAGGHASSSLGRELPGG